MTIYQNETRAEERALYGLRSSKIINCTFAGKEDGESALKECRDIEVKGCTFSLRYPLWHSENAQIKDSVFGESCRAPLWYCRDTLLSDCKILGVKALRECTGTTISHCCITSAEFGWRCSGIKSENTSLASEYAFFLAKDIELSDFSLTGKYSFQYVENAVIKNSVLGTKDAFWHSKDVTVYDSAVSGEYLGWYSENLRLVNCTITGTQPLCYCTGLVLENCTTEGCDFSFENSDVKADIAGNIVSIKNPTGGYINADHIDEIIIDTFCKNPGKCIVKTKE